MHPGSRYTRDLRILSCQDQDAFGIHPGERIPSKIAIGAGSLDPDRPITACGRRPSSGSNPGYHTVYCAPLAAPSRNTYPDNRYATRTPVQRTRHERGQHCRTVGYPYGHARWRSERRFFLRCRQFSPLPTGCYARSVAGQTRLTAPSGNAPATIYGRRHDPTRPGERRSPSGRTCAIDVISPAPSFR